LLDSAHLRPLENTVDQPTVLVVEDHAPARYVRTRILERAGFGVRQAESAADAVLRAPEASLILLDVSLPDGDGFGVCEQVKKDTPGIPVVMITSVYRTAQARRDAFAAGADAFLLEPVEPQQLVRVVERLVRREPGDAGPLQNDRWIVTDTAGEIQDLSLEAGRMLNLSVRGARGRSLTAFFTDDRPKLFKDLLRAAEGSIIDHAATIQPRDKRPLKVHIDISALPQTPGDRVRVLWTFTIDTE
jgi:CheY-like chemotaxis protein